MDITFGLPSHGEIALVRPPFDKIASEISKAQGKTWHVAGMDASKFQKLVIDGDEFIVAASNVFTGVVQEVLPEACATHKEKFGTRNAHAVVEALQVTRPVLGFDKLEDFERFLATEQFALIFKLTSDGSVDPRVLRLDLFRMIKEEKGEENKDKYEFIGGLFHGLKHFSWNGFPLSTGGEYAISHPQEILGLIVSGFFQGDQVSDGIGFVTEREIDDCHKLMCYFYKEPTIDAYFLKTTHIK